MSRVEWDGSLATGHELVDEQHQTLISIFNEYVDASVAGHDARVVEAMLVRLSEYASTHFAEEESLMHASDYPAEKTGAHIEEHRRLCERTRDLVLAHRNGEDSVASLTALLSEWLAGHIDEIDREFVNHIRADGSSRDRSVPYA